MSEQSPEPAEQHLEPQDELREQYAESQRQLAEAREQLAAIERRQQIEQTLTAAGSVDLEASRILTEAMIDSEEDDIAETVGRLKELKPYLFAEIPQRQVGAMSPRASQPQSPAVDAAEQAAESGNRHDLLHYLRLRRSGR